MSEKKENVSVNETVTEPVTEKCAVAIFEVRNNRLVVERKPFKAKDGREMWGYAIFAKVRGRDTKVDFQAYDNGGYEVLDDVFAIDSKAELVIHEESMVNPETGELRKYCIYDVMNVDEEGDDYTARVKLARDSDKSILTYLLKKLNRKLNNDVN